jgi:hypothetical protein
MTEANLHCSAHWTWSNQDISSGAVGEPEKIFTLKFKSFESIFTARHKGFKTEEYFF